MNDKKQYSKVPSGRLSRLAKLGSLATRVASGMVAEGAKQLATGHRPKASELILTPANVKRVADQLADLRGAAMKVGQLLSMDGGDLLPPPLTELLSRLQANAKPMPISQLNSSLEQQWGCDWQQQFSQFSFYPIAAASIGQVHKATTQDGRQLALKIQYPGINKSIDSDVNNVTTLLNISGLIPKQLDISELLNEAKKQLHAEADYLLEAQYVKQYRQLLATDTRYLLPDIADDLTTKQILAMTFVGGVDIDKLVDQPQTVRDHVIELAFSLMFREVFEFRLVQTDPNFANYRYDIDSKQLVLLDFGATRVYPQSISEGYRQLMTGAVIDDQPRMLAALKQIGFFSQPIEPQAQQSLLALCLQACEPLKYQGVYDFGQSDMVRQIRDAGSQLSMKQGYWHTPPADAIFLHRKLGGLYLLAAKLKARVDVNKIFLSYMTE
ncbi:ABC1 kinase family protein [Photobacterium phosphoreum]|jgi:predicted unusual protein kinase regulating ubiquinone biosynthesis (AarF/ABC1/UbiB family)|uniref:Ubiquinol-cytochrome C reductase n=1 Tax=Photobacterium phosphoreum TaxID=659 RepID=A0A2T3JVU3_PHOPO|nr:AarF/ABC1/UbiB kinase family protein [Photobacterium phosphoreum]MCD9462470.1 ubiquinol-cytochrome C reductase [Photobacterium phosphoreum]MCD9469010.1 ubiquinol-cytochrome C reductase [Photobacterium phosphoreum]MCD9473919.1 AarF/ABC1/UbiB kinase family protein [Photobacterium phosphoreum]MCD9477513.1 AarF/ABC1/UbiB kinase family protein [Photobacterium phosphoreum]MCD9482165.1 AarF/ABC1/UbiB kinase family protein [Photobacterium phosphoreum]